jgi:hypothetical protein
MITLRLTDSIPNISRDINRAIAEELNNRARPKIIDLTKNIKTLTFNAIESQPEIQSLRDGILKGAFGIIDSTLAINNIQQSIINSIDVRFKAFDDNLRGGVSINIQPASFSNLLSLQEGFTKYSGGTLHWLEWLLLRGDSVIIVDYQYNPKIGLGRSNLGNMVGGGSFRVPPQFSGSESDNFITRALSSEAIESQISQMLEEVIS